MSFSCTSRHRALVLSLAACLMLCTRVVGAQALDGARDPEIARIDALLEQSLQAMEGVYDYRGKLVKRELFGDELIEQTLEFKFSRPFKVYVKYIEPNPGREGIYIQGSNRDRLRAHKGSVPDVAVSLSPYGRVAMEGNHHPITSFGLSQMFDVAVHNIRKAMRREDATISLSDGGIVHGEPTWRIDLESKSGGRYVTVRRSESLWSLAKRVGQDMYVILHHNDDIDSPSDIEPGQRVFVPNYYASRGQYFIAKRTFMLIKVMSWDQNGKLYESYDFPELELNPGLQDRDFDYRNKDYDFVLINQR